LSRNIEEISQRTHELEKPAFAGFFSRCCEMDRDRAHFFVWNEAQVILLETVPYVAPSESRFSETNAPKEEEESSIARYGLMWNFYVRPIGPSKPAPRGLFVFRATRATGPATSKIIEPYEFWVGRPPMDLVIIGCTLRA
jgi:hypothetical protein